MYILMDAHKPEILTIGTWRTAKAAEKWLRNCTFIREARIAKIQVRRRIIKIDRSRS